MGVPTARTDLSAVAASNSPAGADTIAAGTGPDDYLRAHASLIRANYDDLLLKAPIASPTFTGTVTTPTPFTLGSTSVTATGTDLNKTATIESGNYTPTVSGESNGAVANVYEAQYLRVGDTVTVSGMLEWNASSNVCEFKLTLPVNPVSVFGYTYEASGAGFAQNTNNSSPAVVGVFASIGDNKVIVRFVAANASYNDYVWYHFTYTRKYHA